MLILAKNTGALNIFIMPELHRDAKKSFVGNYTEIAFYRVPFHLLWDFRYKLNDPYLNLHALYEFECEKTVVTSFKVGDFVSSKLDLKLELTDQKGFDVKIFFDSSDNISIKPDKISAPSDIKEKLFSQGEKIKKLSKEIQLKSLT